MLECTLIKKNPKIKWNKMIRDFSWFFYYLNNSTRIFLKVWIILFIILKVWPNYLCTYINGKYNLASKKVTKKVLASVTFMPMKKKYCPNFQDLYYNFKVFRIFLPANCELYLLCREWLMLTCS